MQRVVVTATLKDGSEEAVRRILHKGAPFKLPETSLERHLVFFAGNEIVFFFEGAHAEQEVERLLSDPRVLGGPQSELGSHIEGPLRTPHEVFHWERPQLLEGLSFAPTPGAGDSEGG